MAASQQCTEIGNIRLSHPVICSGKTTIVDVGYQSSKDEETKRRLHPVLTMHVLFDSHRDSCTWP